LGAPVRITGNASGGRVTVRVLDRGEGVPRSERARIFEPFVRGRDPAHGSDLGLAICKGFVEANGGRIALQTGADETAFAVTLPLSPQPAWRRQAARTSSSSTTSRRSSAG
jgi:signal transduction histidine kinase